LASSKRDTDSPRGGASQSDASFRRGGPTDSPRSGASQSDASFRRGGPTDSPRGGASQSELDLEAPRLGSATPQLGRKRLADAAHDHNEWSGASEGDTFADLALPPDEDDFADEDTFTDRDPDTSEIASRDTMREIIGRDTLQDLTATALALSGDPTFDDTSTDVFAADRTLDEDNPFPDEDTFDEPTSDNSGR
jgi:hypothetical protein